MRILVTGAGGQLGREAVLALRESGLDVTGIDIAELDLGRLNIVADGIADYRADWIIHCAAYTQVDDAEENQEMAFRINRDSAAAVASGVKRSGGRMLHVSTDYVFDGRQSTPYAEDDQPNPLNVYGRSKWEGERSVCSELPDAIILRTAWIHGIHGHNFVRTILKLAAEHDELTVVNDQFGTPTWARDIVTCMQTLIAANASGRYHFTNEGVASWYDFAVEIIAQARQSGIPVRATTIRPVSTDQRPSRAQRPAYSVLGKSKIKGILNYPIPDWRESLGSMLAALQSSDEYKQ